MAVPAGYFYKDGAYWNIDGSGPYGISPNGIAVLLGAYPDGANTIITGGDSMTANGFYAVSNYSAVNTEGAYTWVDACLGGAFNMQATTAIGGKTCRQMIDEQFPTILAAKPRYCWFTAGTNDLYTDGVGVDTTYDRIIEAVETLLDAGITPIWSTIWGRVYNATYTAQALKVNERLRRYAYTQQAGLFWDGFIPTHDHQSTNGIGAGRAPLASYFYDSSLHPNNLLGMRTGQFCAASIGSRIYQPNRFVIGGEDVATGYVGSNLVLNPNFTGTSGTVSANCTGTMPTSWIIDWATRTGSGSAAAAIVSLTDATTGLAIGQAIQITISGTPASGDIIRVTQTHTENAAFLTNLSAGNVFNCEGQLGVATGAAVRELRIRAQVNSNESTWWGVNDKTAVDYPATVPMMSCQTRNLTVLGSGAATAARYDMRVTFSGNSSGTVLTFARPRFRKVS